MNEHQGSNSSPILRHSAGWSVMAAGFAFAALAEGYGTAMGNAPRTWVVGSFVAAFLLAAAGAVYAAVILRGASATLRRSTFALTASFALNVAVIVLGVAAASLLTQ
jgi:hypothetical protein